MVYGLILAGGKSRRFGSDKRFYSLGGKLLIERACEIMEKVCDKNFIVVDRNFPSGLSRLQAFVLLRDLKDGLGPLMGIYSSLLAIPEGGFIAIPVDMPNLSVDLLMYIKDKACSYDLIVPVRDGPLPFPGFYSKALLPIFECLIDRGVYSIRRLVDFADEGGFKVLTLSFDIVKSFGNPEEILLNVNRREDIEAQMGNK
ncbi:MAG: molybdenum cofactor guanylyltransferase [Candidatus Caldarchaeum sp.]